MVKPGVFLNTKRSLTLYKFLNNYINNIFNWNINKSYNDYEKSKEISCNKNSKSNSKNYSNKNMKIPKYNKIPDLESINKDIKINYKVINIPQKNNYNVVNKENSPSKEGEKYDDEKHEWKKIEYDQCFSDEEYVIPILNSITKTPHDNKQYNKDHVVRSELYTKHSNADTTIDGNPFDNG